MGIGDTYLTVLGWIGSEPEFRELGQRPQTTFRLGSTPRQFNRAQGRYADLPTTWYSVECWRNLAQNAFESVHVGQPVIVTGCLRTHEWTDDAGATHSRVVLEAFSIGHDLTRGTTTFVKNPPRAEARAWATPPEPAEATAAPFPADEYSTTSVPLTAEAVDPAATEAA